MGEFGEDSGGGGLVEEGTGAATLGGVEGGLLGVRGVAVESGLDAEIVEGVAGGEEGEAEVGVADAAADGFEGGHGLAAAVVGEGEVTELDGGADEAAEGDDVVKCVVGVEGELVGFFPGGSGFRPVVLDGFEVGE